MTQDRFCAACGKVLVRREKERREKWERRKVCDRACRNVYCGRIAGEAARARKITTSILSKECPACGETFFRNEGEPVRFWEKRKTCGNACKGIFSAQRREQFPPKPCSVCGAAIEWSADRYPNAAEWRKKKTCSQECAAASAAFTRSRLNPDSPSFARRAPLQKTCEYCGESFGIRVSEAPHRFRERRFCSLICSNRGNRRIEVPTKFCEICGVEIERKPHWPPAVYNRTRTCGRECGRKLYSQVRFGTARRGSDYPREWITTRKRIRQRDGYRCVLCGQSGGDRAVPVHHINYNKDDMRESNLVTLCASCHTKTNYNRDYWQPLFEGMMLERETQAA